MSEPDSFIAVEDHEPTPRLPRVLIVENDEMMDRLLRDTLEGHANVEKKYARGKEVIDMLHQRGLGDFPLDVLITDAGVLGDESDPFDVADVFKEKFPHGKVIFLTISPQIVMERYAPGKLEELGIEIILKLPLPQGTMAEIRKSVGRPFQVSA